MTAVQRALLDWYSDSGRARLPWRTVREPYYTLVSEFMLQQTQVDRVVPKFEEFVSRWPAIPQLAAASPGDVLRMWKGLGYNSRALRLHGVAVSAVERFGGSLPCDEAALLSLPGIGPYTALAILAFGFDRDVAPVDTNIRRIVHRLRFGLEYPQMATDAALARSAFELVPSGFGHDWNSAMMDLGATICTARSPKCLICPLREHCVSAPVDSLELERLRMSAKSSRTAKESIPFERTARFARGRIIDRLRELPAGERISMLELYGDLRAVLDGRSLDEVEHLVSVLEKDGLVSANGNHIALRD